MDPYAPYRQQIVATAQRLAAQGYLPATGGNLSVRVAGPVPALAITPSNYAYEKMQPSDICLLDLALNPLAGDRPPSVESALHAAVYQRRPDVHAVIHTHQPYGSALTLIHAPIPALFDEQVRFLGRQVEIIPYAPSGTGLLKDAVARHMGSHHNAYLLQNHGVLCLGHDLERAEHNVALLEKCALTYLLALCTERKVSKIPLPVREIAFAKLRADQKKAERSGPPAGLA